MWLLSHIWIVLEIGVCMAFLMITCLWVGKRLGQHRIMKMQDEMRALELTLSQLIDQMELVSGHNLQVMEAKTAEMHELLPIIDKKLLHAHDIMTAIEEIKRPSPAINSVWPIPSNQASDISKLPIADPGLRRDLEEIRTSVSTRQMSFDTRFSRIEERLTSLTADMARIQETMDEFERLATLSLETVSVEPPALETPEPNIDSISSSPASNSSIMKPTGVTVVDSIIPVLTTLPTAHEPLPGSPTHEVLELFKKGITTPQIARILKMGHGEVELIMNIFGQKARATVTGKVACR
ncbi:MAG: hypothetical protein HQM09_01450 [Candidatus Riflebacteria bacterium]|nr:hypothetical protein [Candidatus Riflebacteria bacterium]